MPSNHDGFRENCISETHTATGSMNEFMSVCDRPIYVSV